MPEIGDRVERDNFVRDYDGYYEYGDPQVCVHGKDQGSGECYRLCSVCGHSCEDHGLGSCMGWSHRPCTCSGYSDRTTLDVMAESMDEKKMA